MGRLTHTVSGSIATVRSPAVAPIESLKVHFSPIQEGTGDPSPSNVRPITGWTGVNVNKTGRNILKPEYWPVEGNNRYIRSRTGASVSWSSAYTASGFIPVFGNTQYILHAAFYGQNQGDNTAGIAFYENNVESNYGYISGIDMTNKTIKEYAFITPPNAKYMRFCNMKDANPNDEVWLEYGNTLGKQEAYKENVYPVTFLENTVYGGYVDLVTGELWKEWDGISTTWGECINEADMGDNIIRRQIPMVNNLTTGSSNNICNVAPYEASENVKIHFYYSGSGSTNRNVRIFLPSSTSDSTEIFVITKLASPQLIATLTPQELATFKGYSNFWSNAGDVDVTYQVVESSEMTKERQKIFAGNAPTIHTASGSVANFEMKPGLNRNLKSCKVGFLPVQEGTGDPFPPINQNGSIVGVNNLHNESELSSFKIHFSPIQSGSGDPSPTNIRPITGWTGVTGYKGGKNLLDPDTHYTASHYESQGITFDLNSDGSVTINGTVVEGASSSPQFSFYWTQPITGNYYFCANIPYSGTYNEIYMYDNTVGARCRQWDGVSNGLSSHSARPLCEAQLIAGHRISLVIRISRDTGFAYNNVTCSPMLMASNCTDTTFEPYTAPTSYPVSWESQGTVYGGYVDLVSGEVVRTHGIVDLGALSWNKDSNRSGVFYAYNSGQYTNNSEVISDRYKSLNNYVSTSDDKYISAYTSYGGGKLFIRDTDYSAVTVSEFATALSGRLAVYKLQIPVVVTTLTPTQIALATGKSSYWSNADSVTVETVGNVRPIKGWSGINTIRCSKNLFDKSTVTLYKWTSSTGEIGDSSGGCISKDIPVTPGSTYTLMYNGEIPYSSSIIELTKNKEFIKRNYIAWRATASTTATPLTVTVGEDTYYIYVQVYSTASNTSISTSMIESEKIQLELGSIATAYEPYSGNTIPVTFPAQGKNLFDISKLIVGKALDGYGELVVNASRSTMDYIYLTPGTYTISRKTATDYWKAYKYNLNYVKDYNLFNNATRKNTFTIDYDCYIRISFDDIPTSDDEIQLELGSTETSYEPYNNTLYGGYVDLVSGKVYKTFINVDLSSCYWSYEGANTEYGYQEFLTTDLISTIIIPDNGSEDLNHLCSMYKFMPRNYQWSNRTIDSVAETVGGQIRIYSKGVDTYASANAFREAMYGVKICYELATPVLVTTLTPTQIQALKGTNNILSDANGIIEVKYWSH